jgi:hypothetical protein
MSARKKRNAKMKNLHHSYLMKRRWSLQKMTMRRRRAGARRFSTDSKRRRPNPRRGKANAYPTVRLDRLDPNRFRLIKNLHRHPAWDFQDKKKGGVRQQDHRCQVCRAIGPIWHGKYRGGSVRPGRAKIMCGCEQCPAGFCSMACFNKWHYDNEMPPIKD